jgi:hypothetical protein
MALFHPWMIYASRSKPGYVLRNIFTVPQELDAPTLATDKKSMRPCIREDVCLQYSGNMQQVPSVKPYRER